MLHSVNKAKRLLIDIDAEQCRRSLHTFVKRAWSVVEQGTPFVDNWHIGFICNYLEALYTLEVQNLIINIPPGHAKSLICSVFFPAWIWVRDPASRFFCGSHAKDLATRDAVRSRRLIQSDWYQERFGHRFAMAGDQNVKTRYENDRTGHRVAVGVDAGWTGHRGNYIVWDDPLDKNKKDSDVERKTANEAVKSSFGTRGDNPKMMRRLMIMQRLHEDDPTGHVLQAMREDSNFPHFEHLVLPAEYEPNRFFSSIGLKDPRRKEGELLFPQMFDRLVVRQQKALLGDDAPGQLQQRPVAAGGAIFLREWFEGDRNRYDPDDSRIYNRAVARWIFYDTAFKDEEKNDPTARLIIELLPDYRIILRDAWWERMQVPQVTEDVKMSTVRWKGDGKLRGTVVENKGSGIAVMQTIRQGIDEEDVAKYLVEFNPGTASKPERARRAAPWCSRDCVLLPHPSPRVPWLLDFEENIFKAPNTTIKDPWDCFSMAILYLENILAQGWKFRLGRLLKRSR